VSRVGSVGAKAASSSSARAVAPSLALGGLVLGAFVFYTLLAQLARTPRIFYDELFYTEAASSLARGTGLSVRGEPYDFGVLYPVLLAPIHSVTADREAAYAYTKAVNALFFALTAVPVFLLARRLLQPWPSVGVATLALLVPSTVYVAVVMTESLAYVTSAWAILAIVLVVERPTAVRQVAALSAIGVAALNRPQFLAFYVALVLALGLGASLLPQRRERMRESILQLWPTGLTIVAGLIAFVALPLTRGSTPGDSLGRYDVLWSSYNLPRVGKWLVYHLADLELYLAVVPLAVAPIVLTGLFVRARGGSERNGAFLATFAAANVVTVLLVAFVVTKLESAGGGDHRIHDRYLFYLVPLWLVLLLAWFERGAPTRPASAAALGGCVAVLLPALLPIQDLDVNDGSKVFNAVATVLPAAVATAVEPTFWLGRIGFVLAALALVSAALLLPRRREDVALGALICVFALSSIIAWAHAFEPNEAKVFASGLERRWVDERVPSGSDVTVLTVECPNSTLARDSFVLTEFFNGTIEDVVDLAGELKDANAREDGSVVLHSGAPVEADYLVSQPGLRVGGERLAEGTNARLVLWDTEGAVRIDGVSSTADAVRAACS
jgi:hypothetical protein